MKILVFLIRWGFPLLLITDLSSEFFESIFILNISRSLRIIILLFFIVENIRCFKLIKRFYFFWYFFSFNLILFIYLLSDEIFIDGFWLYSKTLFWTLGINVLYLYNSKNIFSFYDFLKVIKKIVFISFAFTLLFYFGGRLESDYNVAAYLVLFMYPFLLLSSKGFTKNKFFILISALSIIITLKRGAILAFFISTFIYYLFNTLSHFSFKNILKYSFILGSILTITNIFIGLNESQDSARFESDQFDIYNPKSGSGRVGLYTGLFLAWTNSDNFIFGHGNRQVYLTFTDGNTYAHSDLFGFLYNFGLLGVSLILFLYFKLIRFYYKVKKFNDGDHHIIFSVFVILFLINLYSGMLIGSTNSIYFFSILAYLQINNETKKSTYINKSS